MMDKIKKFINIKSISAACLIALLIVFAIISSAVDKKSVQQAYDEFDGSIFTRIENSLIVENKTNPNVNVKYSSSNPTVLDFSYNVVTINRPESTKEDAVFTITLTFSKGVHSLDKEYTATVVNDDYEVSTISDVKTNNTLTKVKLKDVIIVGKDSKGYIVSNGTDYLYVSHIAGYLSVGTVLDIRGTVSNIGDEVVLADVVTATNVATAAPAYSSTVSTISAATALLPTNQNAYSYYKFENVELKADITFVSNKLTYVYYIQDGSNKLYIDVNTLSTFTTNLKSKGLSLTDSDVKLEFEGQDADYVLTKSASIESIELFLSSYDADASTWSALYCSSQF